MHLSKKKILLVEDDNFIADMFIRKLQAEGAICTRAINGHNGLQKLKDANNDFDLIITDIMMAGIDGYEMVLKIKEIEVAKDIPVVVFTNRSSLTEKNVKIKELGIAAFFIKSDTALSEFVVELAEILQK
ncbi:MAG: CheY-like chemotaxis protein [Candidatus Paceibacteria bacterium]|jgi:CheY-like chemotaxis protein